MSNNLLKNEYTKYRFYDNDINQINEVRKLKKVKCIKVDDSTKYPKLNNKKVLKGNYSNYINNISIFNEDSKYFNLLKIYPETYMPSNGITYDQFKDLIKWSSEKVNEKKILFLDWDRTITVVEGMIIPRGQGKKFINLGINDKNIKKDHILIYLLGGIIRYIYIQQVFKQLFDNNVEIYIISNNPFMSIGPNGNREYFLSLLKLINENFEMNHMKSSYDNNGNKLEIIENLIKLNKNSKKGGNIKKINNRKKI